MERIVIMTEIRVLDMGFKRGYNPDYLYSRYSRPNYSTHKRFNKGTLINASQAIRYIYSHRLGCIFTVRGNGWRSPVLAFITTDKVRSKIRSCLHVGQRWLALCWSFNMRSNALSSSLMRDTHQLIPCLLITLRG